MVDMSNNGYISNLLYHFDFLSDRAAKSGAL
jgi:hypothetical protein